MFLKLGQVFTFLKANPNSRCFIEGEELLNSKHIVLCGIKDETEQTINVVAFCLQTSALNGPPHKIEINLEKDDNIIILKGFCSCKAGLSGCCKHISAVLLHCTRFNIKELEKVACTDVEAYWNKSKESTATLYKVQSLDETDCLCNSFKKRKRPLTETENGECLNDLLSVSKESNLVKHLAGRDRIFRKSPVITSPENDIILNNSNTNNVFISDLNLSIENFNLKICCKSIFQALKNDDLKEICNFKQGSIEWCNARKLRITGSRCYSIYTYSKDDWEKKSKLFFNPPLLKNKYVKHGLTFESHALKKYVEILNTQVATPGFVKCSLLPWLGYSPDGIVFEDGKPTKLLEIKCPFIGSSKGVSSFEELPYVCNSEIKKKHMYYAQVQMGMAILNLESCDFILYSSYSNEIQKFVIPFDASFSSILIKTVTDRYFNKMLPYACKLCNP